VSSCASSSAFGRGVSEIPLTVSYAVMTCWYSEGSRD
jgi:hypothetical protein